MRFKTQRIPKKKKKKKKNQYLVLLEVQIQKRKKPQQLIQLRCFVSSTQSRKSNRQLTDS
jgi:TPP-dependent 2-oxoacid decarboxylase